MRDRFITFCICVFIFLSVPTFAAFAPVEKGNWQNPNSDLIDLIEEYGPAVDVTIFNDFLSGNFNLVGIGYESLFVNEFVAENSNVLFSNYESLSGDWSDPFDIDNAYHSENFGLLTHSVQPSEDTNLTYKLNEPWTYNGGISSVEFISGDIIIGLNDSFPDSDFNDLVVGLRPTSNPIPEPTTLFLFATGLLGFIGVKRWRKKIEG